MPFGQPVGESIPSMESSMIFRRKFRWALALTIFAIAGAAACTESASVVAPAETVTEDVGSRPFLTAPSGDVLSPENCDPRPPQRTKIVNQVYQPIEITPHCIDMYGEDAELEVGVEESFTCRPTGTTIELVNGEYIAADAPDPTDAAFPLELYDENKQQILEGIYPRYTVLIHEPNWKFKITPHRPTEGTPIRIGCRARSRAVQTEYITMEADQIPEQTVAFTVAGDPAVLDHMTLTASDDSPRQAEQISMTVAFVDQYDGINLVTPSSVTWSPSDPTLATITGSGNTRTITTGTRPGTVRINITATGANGPVTVYKDLAIHGCTITRSPTGSATTYGGGAIIATASTDCPQGEAVPSGNFVWSKTGPLWIVNDNPQGSQVHINATASGTATATVCTPAGIGQACAPTLAVSIFGTTVTPLTSTTQNAGINTTGSLVFRVTNNSPIAGTATIVCPSSITVTCTGLSHTSKTLNPNQYQDVTASWSTSTTTGAGEVRVNSTGFGSGATPFSVTGGGVTAAINYGPASVKPNVMCEWGAYANGGTGPYTYNWRRNALVSIGTEPFVYFTNSGSTFTLYLDVTDALGTMVTTSKVVTVSSGAPTCDL
jgi:hypothetical protein